MNLTASRPNSSGFTLVEVLMAMLVMTVGLLGLLQSVNVAYRQSLKDRLRKEATLLAEERMHDWCASFAKITSATTFEEQDEKQVNGAAWRFTVTRRAEDVGGSTKKLQVLVKWTVHGEQSRHEIYALRMRRDGE